MVRPTHARAILLAGAAFSMATARLAIADSLPVVGGGAYANGTGFVSPYFNDPSANAINDSGIVIGTAYYYAPNTRSQDRGVLWGAGATARQLAYTDIFPSFFFLNPHQGTPYVHPAAINAGGTVVGSRPLPKPNNLDVSHRAVRWDQLGTVSTDLEVASIGGSDWYTSRAYDINNAGVIVGVVGTGQYENRAVRWNANGTPTLLGTLTSSFGVTSIPAAINNAGVVVGTTNEATAGAGTRAIRWDAAGHATRLGHLGTSQGYPTGRPIGGARNSPPDYGYTVSTATDVNEAGVTIGTASRFHADHSSIGQRAVLWQANSTIAVELSLPGGVDGSARYAESVARDITDSGIVVGHAWKLPADAGAPTPTEPRRAMRWSTADGAGTRLQPLDPADQHTSDAFAANDSNVVVGMEQVDSSATGGRAVLWLPDTSVIDLNALIDPSSGWLLNRAAAISNTGYVAGVGRYDPDGAGGQNAYDRHFSLRLPANGVLIRGDATLDGAVNFADLVVLAQNYDTAPGLAWYRGDFDGDRSVDFDDLVLLAQNYETSATFEADWVLAQLLAPEPTTLVCLAAALAVRRVRRPKLV